VSDAPAQLPVRGWISPDVAEELSSLGLLECEIPVARRGPLTGASAPDVQQRLRDFSSRIRGPRAVAIRREPIPAAYRVFFRHIGLDPDVQRTPIEAAVLERMVHGGFLTGGLLQYVLLLALLDTSVPVWALDAERVSGPLGIRVSAAGETLGAGGAAEPLAGGALVVADQRSPLSRLFGAVCGSVAPGPRTRRLRLFAVLVAGVPELYAEEALWSVQTSLGQP